MPSFGDSGVSMFSRYGKKQQQHTTTAIPTTTATATTTTQKLQQQQQQQQQQEVAKLMSSRQGKLRFVSRMMCCLHVKSCCTG